LTCAREGSARRDNGGSRAFSGSFHDQKHIWAPPREADEEKLD
jgi:hypothetical protein